MLTAILKIEDTNKLYRLATVLAVITILYNLIEGLISVYFGYDDETLALFGFGVDSFVEVISGAGILHMLTRIKLNPDTSRDNFEKTALKITGTGFYVLTAGIVVTSIINLITSHAPDTTFWGVVISSISIVTMWVLIQFKLTVGKKLNSNAIIADANCTKACLYLSIILLASSLGYELTGIGGIDSIGALAIAYFTFKEGRESFEKTKGGHCGCDDECSA
ncbi:MAG: cation transporter [Ignavibacteria bacterium]|jgi:divalent metal cation (Fe/Co/Zn/Cd) transporter